MVLKVGLSGAPLLPNLAALCSALVATRILNSWSQSLKGEKMGSENEGDTYWMRM